MAICDYCGGTYRGGAIKDGPYRYCMGQCHERGKALLRHIEHVPQSSIDSAVAHAHEGPCPSCAQIHNVDVYSSYRIYSALVYCSWKENSYIACRECAHKRQSDDLLFCFLAGWWSPPGLLVTPFIIFFSILAMLKRPNPEIPSERFRKLVKLNLARHLARNV